MKSECASLIGLGICVCLIALGIGGCQLMRAHANKIEQQMESKP